MGFLSWFGFGRTTPQPSEGLSGDADVQVRIPEEERTESVNEIVAEAYGGGLRLWAPRNPVEAIVLGYETTWVVRACIDRIADAVAGIPLIVYKIPNDEIDGRSVRGIGPEARARIIREKLASVPIYRRSLALKEWGLIEQYGHPAGRLLENPNPKDRRNVLIKSFIIANLSTGDGFIQKVKIGGSGEPSQLFFCPVGRMQIETDESAALIRSYIYTFNGKELTIPKDEIIHWKTPNPTGDFFGLSHTRSIASPLDLHRSGAEYNINLQKNSARPSGVLTFTSKSPDSPSVSKSSVQAAKKEIEDSWTGEQNAGRAVVLAPPPGYEVDWATNAMKPVDIAWSESMMMTMRQICAVFKVPSVLVGDPSASTLSNYEQSRKALYEDAAIPVAMDMADVFNKDYMPDFGGDLVVLPNFDGLPAVQEERKKESETARGLYRDQILTKNEARAKVGYGPVDDGDKFYQGPGTSAGNPNGNTGEIIP